MAAAKVESMESPSKARRPDNTGAKQPEDLVWTERVARLQWHWLELQLYALRAFRRNGAQALQRYLDQAAHYIVQRPATTVTLSQDRKDHRYVYSDQQATLEICLAVNGNAPLATYQPKALRPRGAFDLFTPGARRFDRGC
jgi:hypothetical protein